MKVLTVCEYGLNRSVTAKWLVQHRPGDHEVLAAGTANLSPETFDMLCRWAERIILLDRSLLDHLAEYRDIVVVWDVGPDHYEHHYNRDLVAALRSFDQATPWPAEVGAHTRGG